MRSLPGVPQGGRRQDHHGGLLSPRVAIVSTGHDVADTRLHRTAAALVRAGAQVEVFGLGDATAGPPGCSVRVRPRGGMVARLARALTLPFRVRADVMVTIDPDTAVAAWLAARIRPHKWVADVHEDYAALLKDRNWVPRPLLALLQGAVHLLNQVIRMADLVLVADDHVPPRTARNRHVMRNEPDVSLLPELRQPTEVAPWRAIYIGDNRTSRGLRMMVEAVAATSEDAEPWQLEIVGPVAGEDREWFEDRISRPDATRITWHGRQEPRRSWEIADGADIGLCLLANTPAFVDAMPSKVYEYLACGIPTISTPLPRVAEILNRTGAGVIVDSVEETTAALREFVRQPELRAQLRAAAKEAGEVARERRNTYDDAAAEILALVK